MIKYAMVLGMDREEDGHLFWIASEALKASCSCVVVYGADEGLAAGRTGGAMEGMKDPGEWLTVECIGK